MVKKFDVELKVGVGKESGKKYAVALIDLGYRKVNVTFDKGTIAELFGIPVADVYKMLEK